MGVVTSARVTAIGGGIIRDILIGSLPPATFSDWRYLLVAAIGSLVALGFQLSLTRLTFAITVLDAAGLSLFAVTGTAKSRVRGRQRTSGDPGAITAVAGEPCETC